MPGMMGKKKKKSCYIVNGGSTPRTKAGFGCTRLDTVKDSFSVVSVDIRVTRSIHVR